MLRIAILGATSQIARDLILSFSADDDKHLHLFARRTSEVKKWLKSNRLSKHYLVDDFSVFGKQNFDAVINFVGVGNPAKSFEMGRSIFDITLKFDDLVMNYLQSHKACRYLFISSGSAYGSVFDKPVTQHTQALVAINNIAPHQWYGVSKLYTECKHRAHSELSIVDIRLFNYFSYSQDIEAKFLITDILRAIRDAKVFKTSSHNIVRDFIHPSDLSNLINILLRIQPLNLVLDGYSLKPIEKFRLLDLMQKNFNLKYELLSKMDELNEMTFKSQYYSLNNYAAEFGYQPAYTSEEVILEQAFEVLNKKSLMNGIS